jgi:Uma2 family endonuclease
MIDNGILGEDDPVEFLDGCLITKMSKTPRHRKANVRLNRVLARLVPPAYHYEFQDPITLRSSEPEPDASIIRGDPDDYERHPGPGDTPLVIEVSDDSLERDRNWKRRVYAAAGIPVYWIVNLVDRQLEVYADPAETPIGVDYARSYIVAETEAETLVLDGVEIGTIQVRELLPKA